ncbi:GNAT family N-acetyltransferase [Streptomyces sp. NPDC058045]|uniref:GNAT family N-acetyltransferase n=1 Tax=Streptomyces sp. NPDC058045 TaxID=3346311 RepID=UPI0036EA7487
MTVLVRDLRPADPADAEAFAAVRRAALPYMLTTGASVAHDSRRAHPDAHFRPLVAECDGEVVGVASIRIAYDSPQPGIGDANLYVHPARRGRGAGGALLDAATERLTGLGATTLYSWVLDEPPYRAFAARRGYRPSRSAHFLRLDLAGAELPPRAPVPAGVELRTGAEFAADPRPLFTLDAETTADEPSDVDAELDDYEQWLADTWEHPLLDRELTTVAVVDGVPAAFSAALTDGRGRYVTGMTGTARAHRGRGLATLTKTTALHRARAAGCTEAFTGNDTGNEPMLTINRRLGYRVCATEVRHVRTLG